MTRMGRVLTLGIAIAAFAMGSAMVFEIENGWWKARSSDPALLPMEVQHALDALVAEEGEYAALAAYDAILKTYGMSIANIAVVEAKPIDALQSGSRSIPNQLA